MGDTFVPAFSDVLYLPYIAGETGADFGSRFLNAMDRVQGSGKLGHVALGIGPYPVTQIQIPTTIRNVRVEGVAAAPPSFARNLASFHNLDPAQYPSTFFAITGGAGTDTGAAIDVRGNNVGFVGVSFWHPNQTLTSGPTAYPWTVNFENVMGGYLVNCGFLNSYQAVRVRRSYRYAIKGVAGSFVHRGLQLEWVKEWATLDDVYWTTNAYPALSGPAWDHYKDHGEAFRIAEVDGLTASKLRCYGSKVGFRTYVSDSGTGSGEDRRIYGTVSDCQFDLCDYPVQIAAAHSDGIDFSGLKIIRGVASDEPAIRIAGSGTSGSELNFRGLNVRDSNGWYIGLASDVGLTVVGGGFGLAERLGVLYEGSSAAAGITLFGGTFDGSALKFYADQPQFQCGTGFRSGRASGHCNGPVDVTGTEAARMTTTDLKAVTP